MSRLNSILFASFTAGLLAFAGGASAAPARLSGANLQPASSLKLVRSRGGFGGFHGFHGGRHFYGGGHRYSGGWGRGHFRPHYYRHRYYAFPLVVYGGYPYYDGYYDDYGYYDDDVCYYSPRYRARLCPGD